MFHIVFSLQTGIIILRDEEFFIEPVKNYTRIQNAKHHPHVVYKRSALPDQAYQNSKGSHVERRETDTNGKSDFCGVIDKGWW